MKHYLCLLLLFLAGPISIDAQPTELPVHYYTIGEGEPLLLINGGPGWSSHHMKPVAITLSGMGYQVILFDQRGTGKSTMTADSSTIRYGLMVEDIEQIRKKLEIESLIVYGHSFGGVLAMGYATQYPDRVSKLILSAPGGPDLSFLDFYQTNLNDRLSNENRNAVARWQDPGKIRANPKEASYRIIQHLIPAFIYDNEHVDAIMANITRNTWNMQSGNLVWQDLARTGYNLKPKLHRILAPTLIIQGRQDALGEEIPLEISNLIPNSQLKFLEESAHLMWLDRPDFYYDAIKHFLDGPSSSYGSLSQEQADRILSKMKGRYKIESRILIEGDYKSVEGKARFEEQLGGIEETTTLRFMGNDISLRAYIKYSPRYERFELVQVDEAAESILKLTGYWNPSTNTLEFRPIDHHSQWGSTGTFALQWNYTFNEDGRFVKTMKIPDGEGAWILQSNYHYHPETN